MQFLIIQTAFLGDVILATAVAEKLHMRFPDAQLDFLVKKGNESALENHPFIREVMVLDKTNKLSALFSISKKVRTKRYDCVINLHRFGSSGFITWRSGAAEKAGFDKNPFAFCYTKKFRHEIGNDTHETERNQALIAHLTDARPAKPRLYPSPKEMEHVQNYKQNTYYCIAPASVWFTKQFPKEKWMELINLLDPAADIYLLGAGNDISLCEEIIKGAKDKGQRTKVTDLSGKLSLLQTASLMRDAKMNFVNDSAPLHIASAMNAPVTAIFCSTVPAFGFGPLSDRSKIVEVKEKLYCRPCGLHGYAQCPEGHFKCALTIPVNDLLP